MALWEVFAFLDLWEVSDFVLAFLALWEVFAKGKLIVYVDKRKKECFPILSTGEHEQ